MKKKLLFVIAIMAALVCLLAICVSAEEKNPEYSAEYVNTMTSGMTTVELEDKTIVPLYDEEGYTLCYYWDDVESENRTLLSVRTKDLTFKFSGTKLSSIYYGEQELAGTAQKGKIVVITLRELKNSSGEYMTNFNGDNMFKENSPLQHIFMPDSIVTIGTYIFGFRSSSLSHLIGCYFSENSQLENISNNLFWNCKNLKYFNMPMGVKTIGVRAFFGCESLGEMYIPSGVTSLGHDGSNNNCFGNNKNMYFVNTPGEPKPEVYYFPENVTEIKGEFFKGCTNLNDVIVFHENIHTIEEDYAFNGTNQITLVFLGDVYGLNTQSTANWKTLKAIYFCNEKDVDMSSFETVQSNIASAFIFCNAEGNTTHLYKVQANTLPTCVKDGVNGYECFCGVASETAEIVPALGHAKNELLAKYFAEANGTLDYYNDMVTEHSCTRCTETVFGTEKDTALFTKKGYSYSQFDKTSFSYTIYVNADAIKAYNEALLYGIVVSANVNGAPVTYADGAISHDNKTILVEFQNTEIAYSIITAKLTNVSEGTELHLSAYCIDNGAVSYLGHDTVTAVAETVSHEALITKYPDGKEN